MKFLPLHFDLAHKPCLVIGAGEVAARKIKLLLRVKARVTVIAPKVCDTILVWVKEGKVTFTAKIFEESDIDHPALIVAATNQMSVNQVVAGIAMKKNIPINVVDAPELCSVIFPAIVDRDPLIISISSNATSPVLARFVRGKIESVISEQFGDLAKLLERHRDDIRSHFPKLNERRAFIEGVLNGAVTEAILAGQTGEAENLLTQQIHDGRIDNSTSGIYIVYCPAQVDLLNFRALRFMQQADVIFYGDAVNVAFVDLCRRDAQVLKIDEDEPLENISAYAVKQRVVWLKTQPLAMSVQNKTDHIIESAGLASLLLEQPLPLKSAQGEVYLVGGGPGDPDLLTLKALRLMQQADVVLYDRLVSEKILALTNMNAEKIFVGKERTNHPVPQEEINSLLIRLAKDGKRVLRLKGGDPFIFGRGGEEIMELCAHGITFQVVPGITAATACSSYAGIPLTHRDYAQSVRFVAGHMRKDGGDDIHWQQLVTERETLVFYMGLHQLPKICAQLLLHGMKADMPIALVQAGSLPEQHVITGLLSTIEQKLTDHPLKPPTLIIVGDVVKLHNQLAWFNEGSKND